MKRFFSFYYFVGASLSDLYSWAFWRTNGLQPAPNRRLGVHVVDPNMSIKIASRLSRNKEKVYYTACWGKDPGQRIATGISTFTVDQPHGLQRLIHNRH